MRAAVDPLLAELRRTEFARLDAGEHVYLDYTGAGLYAESQIEEHMQLLREHVFGNPHSANPTSSSDDRAGRAGARGACSRSSTPHRRSTSSSSRRTQPARSGSSARRTRSGPATASCSPSTTTTPSTASASSPAPAAPRRPTCRASPRIYASMSSCSRATSQRSAATTTTSSRFPPSRTSPAYTTRSTGSSRRTTHGWDVLLDAAAFVPTNRLDLSLHHPDFVALSFYKMFGWPTGVGALIARRDALAKLERPWFSGGTIVAAFVQREWYQSAPGAAHFEDGTVNFLNLPAIEIGLSFLERVGIERIHSHVEPLTADLLGTLSTLQHGTGHLPQGSMGLPRWPIVARRSPSTSSTPTAGSSTSATSIASPAVTRSRCAPAASATPAPGRWPSPFRAKRSSEESSATA